MNETQAKNRKEIQAPTFTSTNINEDLGLKSDFIIALERLNEQTLKRSRVYFCKHPGCPQSDEEFKGVNRVKEHIELVHRKD